MAHLRKLPGIDDVGFDSGRNLQVIPLRRSSRVYLIAGKDLAVDTDDHAIAMINTANASSTANKNSDLTPWEKANNIRELVIQGVGLGTATLTAKLNGADWVKPLTIEVVNDANSCRASVNVPTVSEGLRRTAQSATLRETVVMVAEDQMNSRIAKGSGFDVYDDLQVTYKDKAGAEHTGPANWCGSFAFWCWKTAAGLKSAANPFGSERNVLRSPQKAISWAMKNSSQCQLLRYEGADPMGHVKGVQSYQSLNGQLQPGDIVLLRKFEEKEAKWKHVCMVHTFDGNLKTMDGNQGAGKCIKVVSRDINQRLPIKSENPVFELVFLHLSSV